MEFGFGYCCPIGPIDFLVFGIVFSPFFLLFVVLPWKILAGTLSFLYDRYTTEPEGAFEASEYVLKNLSERWKGAFYRVDSRHLVLLIPERHLSIFVERKIHSWITIYNDLPQRNLNSFELPLTNKKKLRESFRIISKKVLRCGQVSEDTFTFWISQTGRISLPSRSGKEWCAYCKEHVEGECLSIRCLRCDAPYHLECYQSNAGCAVFGCNQKSTGCAAVC